METGEIPALRKPGRPASPTSEYVVYLVLRYHEMYGIGRRGIEVAMGRDGVQVPRNRMYAVLKLRGLVKDEPRVAVRTAGLLARMR